MKTCSCGRELAGNARVCPNCGKRFTHPFVMTLGIILIVPVVLAIIGAMVAGPSSPTNSTVTRTDSLGRPIATNVTNDAELLVSRCGKPSKDDTTAYDNPHPPIPTRLIFYNKAHLMFAYFPGDGKLGDPPPYSWKLMGLKDTSTQKAISAGELKRVLMRRLPCALGD